MNVKDGVAECADRCRNIHSLPEKVAWIEIHADALSRRSAQLKRRLRVVHNESRMRLDGDFDAMIGSEFSRFLPIGQHLFVPLPLEGLQKLRRPWTGNPVGAGGLIVVSGTTGKGHDDLNLEHFG